MTTLEIEKDSKTGVAVLWLDDPTEKLVTLKFELTEKFLELLDTLAKDNDVKGVVIASKKKDSFIAGADIHQFSAIKTISEAQEMSRKAQILFDHVADFPKTIVAAIHGMCMGGGTEMALACDMRIASDDPKTVMALPEVKLGILPGAGGTQRLPRLVGIQNAFEMMLTGKNIYARKAKKMGLVDEVIHPAALLGAAKKMALEGSKNRVNKLPLFSKLLQAISLGRNLIYNGARKMVQQQSGGHYNAPFEIIACVKTGLEEGLTQGFRAEAQKFGELAASATSKELVRIFFNTTEHKKNPQKDVAKPIRKVGILGSGFMGCGIANVTLAKDIPVLMKDVNVAALERAEKSLYEDFTEKMKKSSITRNQRDVLMSRLFTQTSYQGFESVDIVVEAVFEELGLKRKVLAETEEKIKPECIFASNTSCIPIGDIAREAKYPERVLGMHYFSPVPAMPLLEIIVTDKTAPWALATAYELGMMQGKTMIVVKDGPGFYTTRILAPYMNEVVLLLEEGADIATIDKTMKRFGFPVGPLTLADEVGIDVAAHVSKNMTSFFQKRGITPSPTIEKIFAEGYQGKKNKKGFYQYGKKRGPKMVNAEIYRFFGGTDRKNFTEGEIQNRLSMIMMKEAVLCLEEGILANAKDGDLGAIFGMGFPPFLGGPFRYMDRLGLEKVLSIMKELEQKHGPRFSPPALIQQKADKKETFYQE